MLNLKAVAWVMIATSAWMTCANVPPVLTPRPTPRPTFRPSAAPFKCGELIDCEVDPNDWRCKQLPLCTSLFCESRQTKLDDQTLWEKRELFSTPCNPKCADVLPRPDLILNKEGVKECKNPNSQKSPSVTTSHVDSTNGFYEFSGQLNQSLVITSTATGYPRKDDSFTISLIFSVRAGGFVNGAIVPLATKQASRRETDWEISVQLNPSLDNMVLMFRSHQTSEVTLSASVQLRQDAVQVLVTYDAPTRTLRLYTNGRLRSVQSLSEPPKIGQEAAGDIRLGTFGGDYTSEHLYNCFHLFRGIIFDFYMYSRALEPKEIYAMYNCVFREEFYTVTNPHQSTYGIGSEYCQRRQSSISVPYSRQSNKRFLEVCRSIDPVNCWVNTTETFTPWVPGEANKTEECAVLVIEGTNKGKWVKKECNATYGVTCGPTWKKPCKTRSPTINPTRSPSASPTKNPTRNPTSRPSQAPTRKPSRSPSNVPTENPTQKPTKSPSEAPSERPTTSIPSRYPSTHAPTFTRNPTRPPAWQRTETTLPPSKQPSESPTLQPTSKPTAFPTENPSKNPTKNPTPAPTSRPSSSPTRSPSLSPTRSPTFVPTRAPTSNTCPPIICVNVTQKYVTREIVNVSYIKYNMNGYIHEITKPVPRLVVENLCQNMTHKSDPVTLTSASIPYAGDELVYDDASQSLVFDGSMFGVLRNSANLLPGGEAAQKGFTFSVTLRVDAKLRGRDIRTMSVVSQETSDTKVKGWSLWITTYPKYFELQFLMAEQSLTYKIGTDPFAKHTIVGSYSCNSKSPVPLDLYVDGTRVEPSLAVGTSACSDMEQVDIKVGGSSAAYRLSRCWQIFRGNVYSVYVWAKYIKPHEVKRCVDKPLASMNNQIAAWEGQPEGARDDPKTWLTMQVVSTMVGALIVAVLCVSCLLCFKVRGHNKMSSKDSLKRGVHVNERTPLKASHGST